MTNNYKDHLYVDVEHVQILPPYQKVIYNTLKNLLSFFKFHCIYLCRTFVVAHLSLKELKKKKIETTSDCEKSDHP